MAEQPGFVGPQNFPIRDPRDNSQVNGRNVNPPRYNKMPGGLMRAAGYGKEVQDGGTDRGNIAKVQAPTGTGGGTRVAKRI